MCRWCLCTCLQILPATIGNLWYFLTRLGFLQKCAKYSHFWQGEIVRICQSFWRVTLTST
jgi:hypothetical protein